MSVGELLRDIVEMRKEDVLRAREVVDMPYEGVERRESLFIDAVTAYGIWLSE